MATKECLEMRGRALLISDCIKPDGTPQKKCCDCDHRDKPICGIMAGTLPGMKQCDDCSFPRV